MFIYSLCSGMECKNETVSKNKTSLKLDIDNIVGQGCSYNISVNTWNKKWGEYGARPITRQKALPPGKVENLTIHSCIHPDKLDLDWEAPTGCVSSYEVQWDNSSQDTTKEEKFQIQNLKPGHSYIINVRSIGQRSRTSIDRSVMVEQNAWTKPTIDGTLTCDDNQPNGKLGVRFSKNYQGLEVDYDQEKHLCTTEENTCLMERDLVNGKTYHLKISKTVSSANCRSDPLSIDCTVKPNPVKIATMQRDNGSMTLSWEKPPGEVQKYHLRLNGSSSRSTEQTSMVWSNLEANRSYKVEIWTESGNRQSDKTEWIFETETGRGFNFDQISTAMVVIPIIIIIGLLCGVPFWYKKRYVETIKSSISQLK